MALCIVLLLAVNLPSSVLRLCLCSVSVEKPIIIIYLCSDESNHFLSICN